MVDHVKKIHPTILAGQKSMPFILILICTVTTITFFTLDRLQSPRFFVSKPVPRTRNYDKMVTNKEYDDNAAELQRRLNNATDKKIILIWYPPFGTKQANNIDAANCGNCQATYDRAKISDPSTAAVVFHFNEITSSTMPSQSSRNFDQLHIFWSMEAPPSLRILRGRTLQFENEYHFNATMTYRLDSDILSPYGLPTSKEPYYIDKLHSNLENLLNFKSKVALAVVSNCGATVSTARRLQILKEVVNLGFDLDCHGACFPGNSPFPRGEKGQEAKRKYKFFFSFENSYHCKNYITEKFFSNALDVSAVPVVRGATKEDYEAIAPPGSFIHYDDFSSTKELVEYLNYLDKNDTAYLEYFEWYKLKPEKLSFYKSTNNLCQICRVVHGINLDDIFKSNYDPSKKERPLFTNGTARRTVVSLSEWFYGDNEPECLTQR